MPYMHMIKVKFVCKSVSPATCLQVCKFVVHICQQSNDTNDGYFEHF
jgi:hypothetical protein